MRSGGGGTDGRESRPRRGQKGGGRRVEEDEERTGREGGAGRERKKKWEGERGEKKR